MFLSNTEANASLLLPSYSNDSYNDISLFSRWPFLVLQSTRRRVRASRLSLHQLLLMKGETVVFRVPFFLVPVVLPIPSRNEPSKGIYIISHAGYIGFDSDPNRNTSARILLPRKHFFSFLSYNLSAQRCSNLFSSLSLSQLQNVQIHFSRLPVSFIINPLIKSSVMPMICCFVNFARELNNAHYHCLPCGMMIENYGFIIK